MLEHRYYDKIMPKWEFKSTSISSEIEKGAKCVAAFYLGKYC